VASPFPLYLRNSGYSHNGRVLPEAADSFVNVAVNCPLCGQTYNSGLDVMITEERDGAMEIISQKHQNSPFCAQDLTSKDVKIKIFTRSA
jgi:hypothetical protein